MTDIFRPIGSGYGHGWSHGYGVDVDYGFGYGQNYNSGRDYGSGEGQLWGDEYLDSSLGLTWGYGDGKDTVAQRR